MESTLTSILVGLLDKYPAVTIILIAGGAVPTAAGWFWERKSHQKTAERAAESLERAHQTLESAYKIIESLVDRIGK